MTDTTFDRVVLIDDNEIDLFIERRLLQVLDFSHELITYTSAREALDQLPDLTGVDERFVIFLDLNMPIIDGHKFLDEFETLPGPFRDRSRIIILTSSNNKLDRERALQHKNVVHFITKPLSETHIEQVRTIIQEG